MRIQEVFLLSEGHISVDIQIASKHANSAECNEIMFNLSIFAHGGSSCPNISQLCKTCVTIMLKLPFFSHGDKFEKLRLKLGGT